jgi:hypothetical protein
MRIQSESSLPSQQQNGQLNSYWTLYLFNTVTYNTATKQGIQTIKRSLVGSQRR